MYDPSERKVFISARDSTCDECKEDLGRGAWITPVVGKGALCLLEGGRSDTCRRNTSRCSLFSGQTVEGNGFVLIAARGKKDGSK